MDNKHLPDVWENWSFQGEYLIDDAHNKYHINEIRSLFFQRQLHSNLLGNKHDIVCLKSALLNKLSLLDSEIVIQLKNKDKCIKEIVVNI